MNKPIEIYKLSDFSEHNRKLIQARNPGWKEDEVMGVFYNNKGFKNLEEAKKYKQQIEQGNKA